MFEPITYSLLEMKGGEVVKQFPNIEVKTRISRHSWGPKTWISSGGGAKNLKRQRCVFCGDYKYVEYLISRHRFNHPVYTNHDGTETKHIAGKCTQYFVVRKESTND